MGIIDAIQNGFNNFANMNGRAMRSEFWYWYLFYVVASGIVGGLTTYLDLGMVGSILSLALFIPTICVGVRRLHDIGKSGWYYLIWCIPIIGTIFMIIWGSTDSQPGPNQYGPNPKGINGTFY